MLKILEWTALEEHARKIVIIHSFKKRKPQSKNDNSDTSNWAMLMTIERVKGNI